MWCNMRYFGDNNLLCYFAAEQIDLVLLDVMMPNKDSLTLCKYLQNIQGPEVIMLTAMDNTWVIAKEDILKSQKRLKNNSDK